MPLLLSQDQRTQLSFHLILQCNLKEEEPLCHSWLQESWEEGGASKQLIETNWLRKRAEQEEATGRMFSGNLHRISSENKGYKPRCLSEEKVRKNNEVLTSISVTLSKLNCIT